MKKKKFKVVAYYGEAAYEAMEELKERYKSLPAKEWAEKLRNELGYEDDEGYNPIEVLEFDTADDMEMVTMNDTGTELLPKFYLTDGISDSAYSQS